MAQQVINIGTAPNSGDGDPLREAFSKANANFSDLYAGQAATNSALSVEQQTRANADDGMQAQISALNSTDGIVSALGYAPENAARKGEPNGYAGLDEGGKIPTNQLPETVLGAVSYQGTWNAGTNSPAVPAAAPGNKGWYYIVAVAGATDISGITDWEVGDWVISDGVAWSKVDNTEPPVFQGDSGEGGAIGLVPAPAVGDAQKPLLGNGSFGKLTVEGLADGALSADADGRAKMAKNFLLDEHVDPNAGISATKIGYENANSGLDAQTVQDAIDEVAVGGPLGPRPGTPLGTHVATPYRTWTSITTPSIPLDGTPPRFDEGLRLQAVSFEVSRPNNRLWVEWEGVVARGANTTHPAVTLFLDNETSARAGAWLTPPANSAAILRAAGEMIPGAAGVHTVYANVGPGNNNEPVYLNGSSASATWGGALGTQLRVTEVAGEVITWAGGQGPSSLQSEPQSGTLSAPAPSLTNYTVGAPSGAAPTQGDLASHRYRHHTAVAEHNGRVWVANSSSGTNEDAGGQMTVVAQSPTGTVSFSAPILVMPPQSAFSGTGASYVAGTRISYPRCFAKHEGKLYVISAVDQVIAPNQMLGILLGARECLDDGTVGPLFRISTESYTPASGVAAIDYDPVLGPPLLEQAILYGQWGGTTPGLSPTVSWTMWAQQAGDLFAEPTTVDAKGDGYALVRLWRRVTAPTNNLWAQYSTDGGLLWSDIRETDLPNSPSTAYGIRLPDGRIAVTGNLNSDRDPLYLALFEEEYRVRQSLWYVRQGVPTTPTYPGEYKGGGASYASLAIGATDLWVSYSIAKETIGATRIPLSGL
ncbi:hypothetical protein GGR16_002425 [Chelatococcus caeni]|uniref:Sialidase domain-containing protein n=1 Tax=Chelatococcus caeni TaxID=1348468 RepID=A0A840C392_9HYPH|nr:exo-alpha-sialidase [Chelatococcus caeni]MBB4017396.1 hypothetical protein [Chelatococcus caeni]